MPTLLDGAVCVDVGSGITVSKSARELQADELYNAVVVANEYLADSAECSQCWCAGDGPFDPRCNCDLPLPEVLKLLREFRANRKVNQRAWRERCRAKDAESELWRRERSNAKMQDRAARRQQFGPTYCACWKRDSAGNWGCRKGEIVDEITPPPNAEPQSGSVQQP